MLKRFYPSVEELFCSRLKTFLDCSYDVIIEAKWWPVKAFFSFVGKDESRRGPGQANTVDGGPAQICNRESLPWQPRRCELVHCLGGRGFFLWAFLDFFLWLLPLDASVVQNNAVQSLCGPSEGIQSVWHPGNPRKQILKTFHTPLVRYDLSFLFNQLKPYSSGLLFGCINPLAFVT